jgi:succinoglycan biosynthesis protein ExoA
VKISVIVPCRNEKRDICRFLDSLLMQQLDPDCRIEILVADGMSDDGTSELLRDYAASAPNVRVIENRGLIVSTGLNAAIAVATGDIIIRMDAHTTYAPDYIRQCVRVLEETRADNIGGPWVARGRGIVGKAIAAAFRSRFCCGGGKAHDADYEGEVDTVYLGCWPRSVFERIGAFDPDLVRNQDDEFNFRLRRSGGRIWQSPRIRSSYTPRSSFAALFRQQLQYGFWKVAVIRKHRALASWRHIVPVLFVSSILVTLALTASAALSGMHNGAAAIGGSLATGLAVYIVACIASTLPFVRSVELGALLLMPAVIATWHAGYGLGFLIGIFKPLRRAPGTVPARAFTALTR